MDFIRFTITENDADRRLDRIVRRLLPGISLSAVYKLMRKGLIRLDGKKVPPETRCPARAALEVEARVAENFSADSSAKQAVYGTRAAPRDGLASAHSPRFPDFGEIVLLKTDDLLFVNKPAGIPVHGERSLCACLPPEESAERSLSFRTGALHRLDKDTTGILAFSRTLKGARWFSASMRGRKIGKLYCGILLGEREAGARERWRDTDADGDGAPKTLETDFFSVAAEAGLTLAVFRLHTGVKHQIRRQTQRRGLPLLGDARYGGGIPPAGNSGGQRAARGGYFLHAFRMEFPPDRPAGLPETLLAPFPARFGRTAEEIFGKNVLADILSAPYTFQE